MSARAHPGTANGARMRRLAWSPGWGCAIPRPRFPAVAAARHRALPVRPGLRQGVTATPSEPWDGAVTVAGDRGVILPVTGLIANCDRAPLPSLVT